jgi:hypothetical protein
VFCFQKSGLAMNKEKLSGKPKPSRKSALGTTGTTSSVMTPVIFDHPYGSFFLEAIARWQSVMNKHNQDERNVLFRQQCLIRHTNADNVVFVRVQ